MLDVFLNRCPAANVVLHEGGGKGASIRPCSASCHTTRVSQAANLSILAPLRHLSLSSTPGGIAGCWCWLIARWVTRFAAICHVSRVPVDLWSGLFFARRQWKLAQQGMTGANASPKQDFGAGYWPTDSCSNVCGVLSAEL
jgi:hypothetical protein